MTSFFNEEFVIFTVTFLTKWLARYGGKYAQTGVNSFALIIRSKKLNIHNEQTHDES